MKNQTVIKSVWKGYNTITYEENFRKTDTTPQNNTMGRNYHGSDGSCFAKKKMTKNLDKVSDKNEDSG